MNTKMKVYHVMECPTYRIWCAFSAQAVLESSHVVRLRQDRQGVPITVEGLRHTQKGRVELAVQATYHVKITCMLQGHMKDNARFDRVCMLDFPHAHIQ